MTSLFVLFACIFAFCNAAPEFRKIQTQIVSVNETEFLRDHPEVKLIPLKKMVLRDEKEYKLRYTLGIPGDPLVAVAKAEEYLTERDSIDIYVDYPGDTDFTQTITYIEADVVQDSPYGRLYISLGELGDPSFTVAVLCSEVTNFDITWKFYGH